MSDTTTTTPTPDAQQEPQAGTGTDRVTIIREERQGGSSMGAVLAILALLLILAFGVLIFASQRNSDSAIAEAADSVGAAAESVGNAADAAKDAIQAE